MAIETTPLGFQKPDGNELIRNGDNVISANAQQAEIRIAEDRARLTVVEADIPAKANAAQAAAKTYTDERDAAYRVADRALWRTEDAAVQAAAATDATTKANAAQAAAIADSTTKYGGLPTRVDSLEKSAGIDLVINGSFRDGLAGWGNLGGWTPGSGAATTWARTTSGSDGSLTQSIVIPAHLLGKTLRLFARAMTTSAGTLFTRVTTTAGNADLQHALATGPYVLKTMDVTIPANQGTTPIVLNIGRASGTVYMTAIRLEAL